MDYLLECKMGKIFLRAPLAPVDHRAPSAPWTPDAGAFGDWLLAIGPFGGGGGVCVLGPAKMTPCQYRMHVLKYCRSLG